LEQVFQRKITDLTDTHLALQKVAQIWQSSNLNLKWSQRLNEVADLCCPGAWHCYQDFLRDGHFNDPWQVFSSSKDPNSMDASAYLPNVIVNKANRLVAVIRIMLHVSHDHFTSIAGADDQDSPSLFQRPDFMVDATRKAATSHQNHEEDEVQEVDRD